MTSEILRKSGYRFEKTDEKIIIYSSRRPIEFLFACFLTFLIVHWVAHAVLNENVLLRSIQYIIFAVLAVGPFLLLFFQWRRRIVIQTGRVRIFGTIKGEIDNWHIRGIDVKTERSIINKKITILLNDTNKGRNKLFVVNVKASEVEQLNDFVNQIREIIGLETNK